MLSRQFLISIPILLLLAAPTRADTQDKLSVAENRQLESNLSRAILWDAYWHKGECNSVRGTTISADLAGKGGQEIDIRINVEGKRVLVGVPALERDYVFDRVSGRIGPGIPSYRCANAKDRNEGMFTAKFRVPVVSKEEDRSQLVAGKRLVSLLIEASRKDFGSFCTSQQKAIIHIAPFQEGDPGTYVSLSTDDKKIRCIQRVNFGITAFGEDEAWASGCSEGLFHELQPKIERNNAAQATLLCPGR
jgi:hypothetical protein